MSDRDLYAILEVSRSATEDEIKKAYRRLARELHPDRNPDDRTAEERFKQVAYAKDILTNKEKRKLYDEFGEVGLREGFDPNAYRQYRSWQGAGSGGRRGGFEDMFGGGQQVNWKDNLQDLFGGEAFESIFGGRRRPGRPSQDLISEIQLNLLEAIRGAEKEIAYQLPNGQQRSVRVRIPAGAKDGGRLRLKGQGIGGGDLVLNLRIEAHPVLRREGQDLHMDLPVTVGEAYEGTKLRVPTPDGEVTLKLPAGVESGAKLRLRGKGMAATAKEPAGDLIVHVMIRLPETSTKMDELVQEIERLYTGDVRGDLKL